MHCLAREAVRTRKSILSRKILECASRETTVRIARAFRAGWSRGLSKVGQSAIVHRVRDDPDDIDSLEWLLTDFLVDPLVYRHLAAWCLHLALQESSATFQLDFCPSPTAEERLCGILLAEIAGRCESWARVAAEPLKRTKVSIFLRCMDLSILGGEQATGGDFGLVLHFEERWTRPARRREPPDSRIVPLIFQAKRYIRPRADVSRHHAVRGYQHGLLTRNKCASAYIFFENGTKRIDRPMPPLIKPVDRGPDAGRTDVFEDSLDLSSYLFKAMYEASFGPTASSPVDALRMIFANANIGQLATLAVISDSSTAILRYERTLQGLERDIRRSQPHRSPGGWER